MKLYHGSDVIVKHPRILAADRIGDFGDGFYTTTDPEQARRFVRTKCDRKNLERGWVSVYEIPDDFLSSNLLKKLIFQAPDEAWINFVMANRKDPDFGHDYDLIYGPVANDQVYASLALFESELLDFNELLARLKVRKLTDQILFHTERSLLLLTYVESEVVECLRK